MQVLSTWDQRYTDVKSISWKEEKKKQTNKLYYYKNYKRICRKAKLHIT